MRNQYPGTCYRCGEPVAAGAGHFERFRGGWRTQHATCAIQHRARDSGSDAERGDANAAPSEGSQSGLNEDSGIAQTQGHLSPPNTGKGS